jgi:hypothetical protein
MRSGAGKTSARLWVSPKDESQAEISPGRTRQNGQRSRAGMGVEAVAAYHQVGSERLGWCCVIGKTPQICHDPLRRVESPRFAQVVASQPAQSKFQSGVMGQSHWPEVECRRMRGPRCTAGNPGMIAGGPIWTFRGTSRMLRISILSYEAFACTTFIAYFISELELIFSCRISGRTLGPGHLSSPYSSRCVSPSFNTATRYQMTVVAT